MQILNAKGVHILFLLGSVSSGRTTNKYTSLPNGGFHHHGGFLGGYFDFYIGSRHNPADSFTLKYAADDGDFDVLSNDYYYNSFLPEDVEDIADLESKYDEKDLNNYYL